MLFLFPVMPEILRLTEEFNNSIRSDLPIEIRDGTITIGRSQECDYQIGKHFRNANENYGRGISRVQATIAIHGTYVQVQDGAKGNPSSAGLFKPNGERIHNSTMLRSGEFVYLYKQGSCVVRLARCQRQELPRIGENFSDTTMEGVPAKLLIDIAAIREETQAIGEGLKSLIGRIDSIEEHDRIQTKELRRHKGALLITMLMTLVSVVISWQMQGKNTDKLTDALISLIPIAISAIATGSVMLNQQPKQQ